MEARARVGCDDFSIFPFRPEKQREIDDLLLILILKFSQTPANPERQRKTC